MEGENKLLHVFTRSAACSGHTNAALERQQISGLAYREKSERKALSSRVWLSLDWTLKTYCVNSEQFDYVEHHHHLACRGSTILSPARMILWIP